MRRFTITFAGTLVVLGSSLIAAGQDKAPAQAPMQAPGKAPMQAPMQAPGKAPMQAPMQAPSKAPAEAPMQAPSKVAPVQAPTQAPGKAPMQAQAQAPVQKGGYGGPPMASAEVAPTTQYVAMGRPGLFRRGR
jgi:hypothetical protein